MNNTNKHYWSMTEGSFLCLLDKKRAEVFKKSIKKAVNKGDVVVDLGAGSGILAMFAANAGARKVYAVENDINNVNLLKNNFELNSVEDKIEILNSDALKVKLPEKVDVIICEMLATGLIDELQTAVMNSNLKYLKKGGKIVLQKYDIWVDLVNNPDSHYGLYFKNYRYEYSDRKETWSKVLSGKEIIKKVDFTKTDKNFRVNEILKINITKRGEINALRLGGDSVLFGNIKLGGTAAYSYPIILPIEKVKVSRGDVFNVHISYKIGGGMESLKYGVEKYENK